MRSIFKKELSAFFSSIVGYVAIGAFLVACGLFLWVLPDTSILEYGYANLDRFFSLAPWLLLILIPAVTMRSFADEYRSGTIEWLATKPVTDLHIILGKYFASLALALFALLPTLLYIYTVHSLAAPKTELDWGGLAGSYIGLISLAAGFTAVGIFCSSLASNQIVGFLVALFACFILHFGFGMFGRAFSDEGTLAYYLNMTGMEFHYNAISQGLVDSRDLIYFLSIVIFFVALTRWSLRRRTWDTAVK